MTSAHAGRARVASAALRRHPTGAHNPVGVKTSTTEAAAQQASTHGIRPTHARVAHRTAKATEDDRATILDVPTDRGRLSSLCDIAVSVPRVASASVSVSVPQRDPDVVSSSRLPEIAPLDNDRRCFQPNLNDPQCRTLIKDGTSGHGQPHVLPREREQDGHLGVPTLTLSTRAYGLSPGRAGLDIVPTMPNRLRSALRTMLCRATLEVDRSSASLQAT